MYKITDFQIVVFKMSQQQYFSDINVYVCKSCYATCISSFIRDFNYGDWIKWSLQIDLNQSNCYDNDSIQCFQYKPMSQHYKTEYLNIYEKNYDYNKNREITICVRLHKCLMN